MFNGKEDDPSSPEKIKDKILIHHKLPEIVPFPHFRLQLPKQGLAFFGAGRMRRKGAPRLRISAQQRNDVVEQPVEKVIEGASPFWTFKRLDRIEIATEVLGKDRRPEFTGHSGFLFS